MEKRAFITGGTGGIGKALAHHYSKTHKIGVCGGSLEANEEFIAEHPTYEFFDWDVTKRSEGIDVLKSFCKDTNSLDKLIVCAGINDGKPHATDEVDFDRAEKIVSINIQGVLNSIEAAFPYLKKDSQIVVVSSAAALSGFPSAPAYVASKSAIMSLCESLSIRFLKRGIAVTCLMPGYIDTPLARATHPNLEKMPFVLTIDEALPYMTNAIDKRKARLIFPFGIKFIGLIFQLMPRWLFSKIYARIEDSSLTQTRGEA